MEDKMEGKVKWFNRMKEYGFITGTDGKDYFVHVKDLTEGTQLEEGSDVTFEPAEGDRGLKATKVSLKTA